MEPRNGISVGNNTERQDTVNGVNDRLGIWTMIIQVGAALLSGE